jgi:phosphoserine phosphatase
MTHVATLVYDPRRPVLDAVLVETIARILPAAQMLHWLAEAVAADIPFIPQSEAEATSLNDDARHALAGAPIDIIIQPGAGRRKKLLVADTDSTMIGQECVDELADFLGINDHVAEITARVMRGEIDFASVLLERIALLAGLSVEVVDKVLAERITFTPGGETLVKTMRAHGAFTALVSGGFAQFTVPIAERLGFHTSEANRLIVADGRLTGTIAEPVRGAAAKRDVLVRLRRELDLKPSETLAVGDGANDLAMLTEAGLGAGFHPKPVVAAQVTARIDHADLTALLYAQGYRREEFWE